MPFTNLFWLAGWEMDEYTALEKCNLPTLTKACGWTPTYWHPWYEAGRRCLQLSTSMQATNDPRQQMFAEMGRGCIDVAAFLNSSDYRMWISAARVAWEQGDYIAADEAAKKVLKLRPYKKDDVKIFLNDN